MLSGYVLWDGDKYACSDKCLYRLEDAEGNLWTLESFSDYAEQRESEDKTFGTDCYWTDWYECDEYTCYICEQIYIENKKKGKFSKQQPNFLSKEGAIKNNVNRIIKGGLESDYVEMNTQKGLQRLQVLQFPIVISINVGSKDKPNYKTLRLKEVYTSKKMDDSSMVYDYNNDMYIASGWKAVYEDFETLGSMQQNPVSFIYGPRSTYNYLQNQIKERDAAINKAQEKTAEKVDKKSTVQKIVGTGFSTTATNDSVEYVS